MELIRRDNALVLKVGEVFKSKFTFDGAILFAKYVSRQNSGGILIVQTMDLIHLYFDDGESNVVHNLKSDSIWCLDIGVVIKCGTRIQLLRYSSLYFERILDNFAAPNILELVCFLGQTFAFVASDNRRIILVYELDLDGTIVDATLVTEFMLEDSNTFDIKRIFITLDENNAKLFTLVLGRVIKIFNEKGHLIFAQGAINAFPLASNRNDPDILVLCADASLKIWTGTSNLRYCNRETIDFSPITTKRKENFGSQTGMRKKKSSRSESTIVDSNQDEPYLTEFSLSIKDIVPINSTTFKILYTDDSQKTARYMAEKPSHAVEMFLEGLRYLLPLDDFLIFSRHYHQRMRDETLVFDEVDNREFRIFASTLLASILPEKSIINNDSLDDWDWISKISLIAENTLLRRQLGILDQEPFHDIVTNANLIRQGFENSWDLKKYKWSIIAIMNLVGQDLALYSYLKTSHQLIRDFTAFLQNSLVELKDSSSHRLSNQLHADSFHELWREFNCFDFLDWSARIATTRITQHSMYSFVSRIGKQNLNQFPICGRLKLISKVYMAIFQQHTSFSKILEILDENQINHAYLDTIPPAISTPIKQIILSGSYNTSSEERIKGHHLLRRLDLGTTKSTVLMLK